MNVFDIWIGPHKITIAKFCHIKQLTYHVWTVFFFSKPCLDNVNISSMNDNVKYIVNKSDNVKFYKSYSKCKKHLNYQNVCVLEMLNMKEILL